MARRVTLIVAMAMVGALVARVETWGGAGHHIVSRIAWSQMTPAAKQLVHDLLGDEDFVEISTWADRVRADRPESYNWHFVNIPYAARAYDPARDCVATDRGDCVIAAIERARAEIVNPSRSRDARAESLKYLVHFVGDMHQPLHNIGNEDRGGNDVATTIEGFEPAPGRGHPNLHSAWDSAILARQAQDEAAYAARIVDRLAKQPLDEPGTIDVVKWSLEARDLAVKHVYAYQGFAAGTPLAAPAKLDKSYQDAALPVIELQLTRAGVRLARILNAASGSNPGTNTRGF